MESRKPVTRWTRPAPERELPRACVAPGSPEEAAEMARRACPDGCAPGGCCLAPGWDASSPAAWWKRRLTADERAALESCRSDLRYGRDLRTVADLADECWRAGCPLEDPSPRSRRGAGVPGCPGFCDALPAGAFGSRARWRLEGWLRELTPGELGALRRCAIGCWTAADKAVAERLCRECEAQGCQASTDDLYDEHMTLDELGCPGFCIMVPDGMWR